MKCRKKYILSPIILTLLDIHVESGDGMAKFEIENEIRLIENNGLKPKDLKLAESILEENLENFRESWMKVFGSK